MTGLIDVHTHLDKLSISVEEALKSAEEAGVERVITIGTEPEDHARVLKIARENFPKVHCTLGVHPHEAEKYNEDCEKFILENATEKEVVAVGEIGLDYFYDHADREVQKKVFERQLELARELKMPVQVHTREAEADTIQILKKFEGEVFGILHCFTSSQKLAEFALSIGWNISFSGILTFKNAQDLRDTAEIVPLDRFHVETDAPYLAPIPHRGKKNQPAWVSHTAEFLANLKGVSVEELKARARDNALKMFPKLSW